MHQACVSRLAKVPDHAAELAAAFATQTMGRAENPFESGKASQFYDEDMLQLESESENTRIVTVAPEPKARPE